jgi:hypothetical protein
MIQVLIIDVDPVQRSYSIKSHLPRKKRGIECVEKRDNPDYKGDARNKLINNCLNETTMASRYWLPRHVMMTDSAFMKIVTHVTWAGFTRRK